MIANRPACQHHPSHGGIGWEGQRDCEATIFQEPHGFACRRDELAGVDMAFDSTRESTRSLELMSPLKVRAGNAE